MAARRSGGMVSWMDQRVAYRLRFSDTYFSMPATMAAAMRFWWAALINSFSSCGLVM